MNARKSTLAVAACALGLGSLTLASCSGNADRAATGTDVESFEIREELKTASRSFLMQYANGDSAYLTLSATVQWPVKLGDANLIALQDTLIASINNRSPYSIDEAMGAFVSDYNAIFDEPMPGLKATAVDTVPPMTETVFSLESSVTARVTELTEQTVTYQITDYSFTGGAHPNTVVTPLTYDLKNGKVLTFDGLFTAGADATLLPLIEDALASQYGVSSPKELARIGFFTDQLTVSKQVFVADGQLVFHYNPYEIAPYVMGQIDVPIAPFAVESILTPEAKALLLQ
ncbi:MAG: DUF3298 and DUF4163 domain-containing protein [Candidatus Amulumruptor caecigallinarius]|nr:DUF3298 and DUF4163 domain-containing protein [Candidatus Amulumruptor caecigallinarius]MCM1396654.1 DUF3298 and DUF4163 domain-containing protein [Candidatus Amulumruptor caecigallinarius]MCM1453288.1 DUF3298 and DUF4163 domain-containing protein [bacterium]